MTGPPLTTGELLAAAAIIHTRANGRPHLVRLADRLTQAAPPPTETTDEGNRHVGEVQRQNPGRPGD